MMRAARGRRSSWGTKMARGLVSLRIVLLYMVLAGVLHLSLRRTSVSEYHPLAPRAEVVVVRDDERIGRDEKDETVGRDDDRPTFVLHVGPGKTGTTAVQSFAQSSTAKKLLSRDDYAVLDHAVVHRKDFFGTDETGENVFAAAAFVPATEDLRRKGRNVFASSEYLRKLTPGQCALWRSTFGRRWRTRIVLTYRRLYEKLPSLWNQRVKHCRTCDPDTEYVPHARWPGIDGDYRVATFEEWFVDKYYAKGRDVSNNGYRDNYDSWRDCSDERVIVDVHDTLLDGDDHDVLVNFFCKGIAGATSACATLKKTFDAPAVYAALVSNPSLNHDYDVLAVHAYEHGMLGDAVRNDDRQRVGSIIQDYVESNDLADSLPLVCPNATLTDFIYQWSLETEKWVRRHSSPAEQTIDLADFDAGWERTLASNKFCAVNATEFFLRWPALANATLYVDPKKTTPRTSD